METVYLILTGFAGGLLGGMGMGGGTLLIPMLTIFFAVSQHTAQAINLTAFIPMSAVALTVHIKNKLVDFKKCLWVIIPSCLTAVAGSFAAKNTEGALLQKLFGGFLILLAVFQVITIIIDMKKEKENSARKKTA